MSTDYDLENLIPAIRAALQSDERTRDLAITDDEIIRSVRDIANNQGNIAIGNNNVQTIIRLVIERVRPHSVQHPVPDISRVVGRERQLTQLQRRLGQTETLAIVAALGMPGIGIHPRSICQPAQPTLWQGMGS